MLGARPPVIAALASWQSGSSGEKVALYSRAFQRFRHKTNNPVAPAAIGIVNQK